MTLHSLKIDDHWYRLLWMGIKTCEIRYDDRDYQTGDRIRFLRGGSYSQEWEILHVLKHVTGLQDGYVVLSLRHPDTEWNEQQRAYQQSRADRLSRSNAALRGQITKLRQRLRSSS